MPVVRRAVLDVIERKIVALELARDAWQQRASHLEQRVAVMTAEYEELTSLTTALFEHTARLEMDAVMPPTSVPIRAVRRASWLRPWSFLSQKRGDVSVARLYEPRRSETRSAPSFEPPGTERPPSIKASSLGTVEARPRDTYTTPLAERDVILKHSTDMAAAKMAEDLQSFLASGLTLTFEEHAKPDVSVIVVTWNQAHFTYHCLRALQASTSRIEIILIDNASSDETPLLLGRLRGARVIRNAANQGFLLATNQGAGMATGADLLLLNNDAFVEPDAIDVARSTLSSSSHIGAVGARLLLADGRLQEAGSIVWADGSTSGYGRGAMEEASECMFRRDVDYCSAAFLLTPRIVWDALGGFDASFAPAYYEDVDYCLRLNGAGLRTVYEPDAVVHHVESGSAKTKENVDSAIVRNRKTLRRRHSERLRSHHLLPASGDRLVARHAASARGRRLLIVDDAVPLDVLGSGFPRARQILIEAVTAGWSVTLYTTSQTEVDWAATRAQIPAEVELVVGAGRGGLGSFIATRLGYFDVAWISRPHNMTALRETEAASAFAQGGARVIYDAEALFSVRGMEQARVEGRPLPPDTIGAAIEAEVALCGWADAIACVSGHEASLFRQGLPRDTRATFHVLSHPTIIRWDTPAFDARRGFLFVGRLLEKASPNWDGLSWFIRTSWAEIRDVLPDATLTVAGFVHADHLELTRPGITLTGPVADLAALYDTTRVFIAPIRFAAGVPIKVLEACAAGLPTVGTSLMARQLGFADGTDMIVADDPGAFARGAIKLHEEEPAWSAMRDAANARLLREYGVGRFRDTLRSVLDGEPTKEAVVRSETEVGRDTTT